MGNHEGERGKGPKFWENEAVEVFLVDLIPRSSKGPKG